MDKGIFHCVVDLSMNHLYRFRHQVGTDMEDVVHDVVPAKKRLVFCSTWNVPGKLAIPVKTVFFFFFFFDFFLFLFY